MKKGGIDESGNLHLVETLAWRSLLPAWSSGWSGSAGRDQHGNATEDEFAMEDFQRHSGSTIASQNISKC